MSSAYGYLCSMYAKLLFGEVCQTVVDFLFGAYGQSLNDIIKSTKLLSYEVIHALNVLIQYNLVSFSESGTQVVYELKCVEFVHILRYPKYLQVVDAKYGVGGKNLIESLMQCGRETATCIISNSLRCDPHAKLENYRHLLLNMVQDKYIKRAPQIVIQAATHTVPKFHLDQDVMFSPPPIDLQEVLLISKGLKSKKDASDAEILWCLNPERFHLDMLDAIMIEAVEQKHGSNTAECFRHMLNKMHERNNQCNTQAATPFTFVDLKQTISKQSKTLELLKFLDQYVSILANDSLGFIRKVGDAGNGEYVVDMRHAYEILAMFTVESFITERFGSKAARIFRVIRFKKYIEQEELQKEAMLTSKEAKLLSYNLFTEQFVQIRTVNKGGSANGSTKAFFLFHLNKSAIVKKIINICYRALQNQIEQTLAQKKENIQLMEKEQKLESLIASMRARGESEEYIQELQETLTPPEREILSKMKERVRKLSKAELDIDETLFLLEMYMHTLTC